jgi:hypothetical protein
MQLYLLPLANCCCNYEVIAPGVADRKRIHIPVPAYLIHLDDGSLALVDTGMNRVHISDEAPQDRGQGRAARVAARSCAIPPGPWTTTLAGGSGAPIGRMAASER